MKIWTLLTDSDEGTFSQVFTSEADRDTRCFDLCKDKWDDEDGDMPQDWRAAYAVMQGRSCEWWFHLAEHDIPLPAPAYNCLPAGETLEDLCRRDHICGFDLAFVADATPFRDSDTFGSDMQVCNPSEATRATIYAMNDLGESIPVHDVELTEAGADEVAATCRALFSAIVLAHRPQPDAAQIHQAEQDRISSTASLKAIAQLIENRRIANISENALLFPLINEKMSEAVRKRFGQLAGIDLGGNDQTVISTIGPNGEVRFVTGSLQEDDGEPDRISEASDAHERHLIAIAAAAIRYYLHPSLVAALQGDDGEPD